MAYGVKPPRLAESIINLGEAAEFMFDHNIFQDNLVAADAGDPARNKMSVTRVFAFHEDAVAAKNRRRAVALDNPALPKSIFV